MEGKGMKGEGKGRRENEGREEKGRGAYRDERPLTKILNTPLDPDQLLTQRSLIQYGLPYLTLYTYINPYTLTLLCRRYCAVL